MRKNIACGVLAVLIVAGLSACEYGEPKPEPTKSTKASELMEKIDTTSTATKALCTKLDYVGDRDNPTAVTLTCQDGDEITIPGPFTEDTMVGERRALPGGGSESGDDGIVDIVSKQGKHHVWYYLVANGELRVFYDEQLVQRTSDGEKTSSRVVMRNFTETDVTSSIVWQ